MEWVDSTLHGTPEHGIYRISTADAHTSAASNRLNWRPSRFKWTRPFRRKTKSGFCVCAITFQTQCTLRIGELCSLTAIGKMWPAGRWLPFYLHNAARNLISETRKEKIQISTSCTLCAFTQNIT